MENLLIAALVILGIVALVFAKKYMGGKAGAPQDPSEQAEPEPAATPADNVPLGVRFFMKGRYEEAFELLEPAAHEDNLRAQQLLAKMYFAGNGVPADREQYIYWLKRAAANGDKPSKIKVKKIEAGTM